MENSFHRLVYCQRFIFFFFFYGSSPISQSCTSTICRGWNWSQLCYQVRRKHANTAQLALPSLTCCCGLWLVCWPCWSCTAVPSPLLASDKGWLSLSDLILLQTLKKVYIYHKYTLGTVGIFLTGPDDGLERKYIDVRQFANGSFWTVCHHYETYIVKGKIQ